jgi:hypothetical protein
VDLLLRFLLWLLELLATLEHLEVLWHPELLFLQLLLEDLVPLEVQRTLVTLELPWLLGHLVVRKVLLILGHLVLLLPLVSLVLLGDPQYLEHLENLFLLEPLAPLEAR